MSLLQIENLNVSFKSAHGQLKVVNNFSLHVEEGEILGLVGESGSGKSMIALSIMGLLSKDAIFQADYMSFDGQDLLKMDAEKRRHFITSQVAIIFQEPQTSLNPCFSIGYQLDEAIKYHDYGSKKWRRKRSLELLEAVGIPDPEARLKSLPHQLSGGMTQRVMIAMAIACRPKLLIADEPTTALDVTIEAQILRLLLELNNEHNMALMLITHDFATLSEKTHNVGVMYCGEMVEHGNTQDILTHPWHPYTKALLDSVPHFGQRHTKGSRLFALRGTTPAMHSLPVGCNLGPRCPNAAKECVKQPKMSRQDERILRCHFPVVVNKETDWESIDD